MNKHRILISALALSLLLALATGTSQAQRPTATPTPPKGGQQGGGNIRASALGTAFTYQGQLKQSGSPVNATCDLRFGLWDSASGGNQVGSSPQIKTNVQVVNGLFTIELDFGNAFTGDARWLEIEVRCPAGSGNYTSLTPRQALNATPYTLYATSAPWVGLSGVPAGFSDGIDNDALTGLSCTNGQTAQWNGTAWTCADDSLTLPFTATVNTSSDAFAVTNTGAGKAGYFKIDNPASTSSALQVESNGTFADALGAVNFGTGRAAGFRIKNSLNSSAAFTAMTDGTGRAAELGITNSSNNSPVIAASTYGGGSAAQFFLMNPASNAIAFLVVNNGTGRNGVFQNGNPANSNSTLSAASSGSGSAFDANNLGSGMAGQFMISNTTNSQVVLSALTLGTGPAGSFEVRNPASDSIALQVRSDGTGWLGNFTTNSGKGVYISVPLGNEGLNVASGTKNAVVATTNGARLLYTEESSQVWFTDYGFGRLQNGSANIAIDPLFSQTINLDEPYHVFVQTYGDAELYVTNRTRGGFEVRARDGAADVEFSYRLVAKRKGFEEKRLERAAWADNDPNLYPVKRGQQ